MNQQIRELAEQAGIKITFWNIDDLEKFAKLIVQECATICKDTAEKQFSPLFSRESDGAEVCYKKIKEHFGVEE